MFKFLLIAAFIPALLAFEQCSSGQSTPDSVVSPNCAAGETCQIVPGDTVELTAVFTAAVSADQITPKIFIFVGGAGQEMETSLSTDACANITPGCPVVAGQQYTYSLNVAVNDIPVGNIDVEVELSIVDAVTEAALTCIRFPAHIQ